MAFSHMDHDMTRTAVIGAGITGEAIACALTQRGFSVTVLEHRRYAAMEISFANGGQLWASDAEIWNSTVMKGLYWTFTRNAPLLTNPRPIRYKNAWIAESRREIRRYRDNTVATVRLAIAAREHLFSIIARVGIDLNLERRGILHSHSTRTEFDAAVKINGLLCESGVDRHPVSASEIRVLEPCTAWQALWRILH